MKNLDLGDTSFMAIKLDTSNAYGRVEWGYLENIMRKMGFVRDGLG